MVSLPSEKRLIPVRACELIAINAAGRIVGVVGELARHVVGTQQVDVVGVGHPERLRERPEDDLGVLRTLHIERMDDDRDARVKTQCLRPGLYGAAQVPPRPRQAIGAYEQLLDHARGSRSAVATDEQQRAVRALDHFLGDAADRGPAQEPRPCVVMQTIRSSPRSRRSRDRDRGALVLRWLRCLTGTA